MGYKRLAAALTLVFALPVGAQVSPLQVQVVEGDRGIHTPGSLARPIIVEVTDPAGRPVPATTVTFHLPVNGPGGTFIAGMRTTIATTDTHGRAAIKTLRVNRTPGQFLILIVASKDQSRAGIASTQSIAEPGKSRSRWYVLATVVGGGAAAGILASQRRGSRPVAVTPNPLPTATAGTPSITVGAPSITLGKP